MKTLKTVEEVAVRIHETFASAYAIGEAVNHEWLKNVITQDRADIRAVLVAGLKAKYKYERSMSASMYDQALDDILTLIVSIFKE